MPLFKTAARSNPTAAPNDLIAVSLKTLIDLVRPATGLVHPENRMLAAQSGAYLSRFKGRGMEFDETRLYQAGDDLRTIDWRVTARTGKPHTKVYREERERPVFIAVDDRQPMHFATRGVFKSVQAAKLAALLTWSAQQQGDRIGGQIFSDSDCYELKPQNGKQAALRFLHALVNRDRSPLPASQRLDDVLSRLVKHARPGSRVYLISDFRGINSEIETHLARLSKHCDVALILVYDELERQLSGKGRYRFTDGSREVVVDADDEPNLANYRERFNSRLNTLQRLARKDSMRLILCATTDDPLQCLKQLLRGR